MPLTHQESQPMWRILQMMIGRRQCRRGLAVSQRRERPTGMRRGMFEPLEARQMLAFNPTGQEQEMLELINGFRRDASRNYDVLERQGQVTDTLRLFNVNQTRAEQQFDALAKNVPPLAWDEARLNAARAHANTMKNQNVIRHSGHTPENVLGVQINSPVTVETMHAMLAIDVTRRGSSTDANRDGIIDSLGHRKLLARTDFVEIGVGIATRARGQNHFAFVNQQFERATAGQNPFVMGVVFKDTNDNNRYDAGEGLGGVTIHIVNATRTLQTITMSAGGFQIRVPAGSYDVIAQGEGVGTAKFLGRANVTTQNVKLDLETKAGSRQDGVITGFVFEDTNQNGRRDSGERGLANRTVFVSLDGNAQRNTYEVSATTSDTGFFRIVGAPAGFRIGRLAAKNGFVSTTGDFTRATVIRDQTVAGVHFGQIPV
ncbi:MAG TPA: CAP domain-containing protein [Pirellulaceae bacterium]